MYSSFWNFAIFTITLVYQHFFPPPAVFIFTLDRTVLFTGNLMMIGTMYRAAVCLVIFKFVLIGMISPLFSFLENCSLLEAFSLILSFSIGSFLRKFYSFLIWTDLYPTAITQQTVFHSLAFRNPPSLPSFQKADSYRNWTETTIFHLFNSVWTTFLGLN